jgi:integrase
MRRCVRFGIKDYETREFVQQPAAQLLRLGKPLQMLSDVLTNLTSCRVSEALQLKAEDIVCDRLVFRRATAKTKQTH